MSFDGQIYDAFSLIASLIEKAESNLILIDNYIDLHTLNLLSKKKQSVVVTAYTLDNSLLTDTDVKTFNAQYPLLEMKYTQRFHDRFLIVDNTYGYHIGASIKTGCFGLPIPYINTMIGSAEKPENHWYYWTKRTFCGIL